ncbi:MAG TPA: beta-propeller fold lactonase family protein [Streptosporangiaceae bacterium]|jgi:DNA-binding beta-propeller fold protein YncE
MKSTARFVTAGAAALAATALLATPSLAATHGAHGAQHPASGAVFVQTDGTGGNAVVVYDRHGDGTLTQAGQYATGGLGGILAGAVVDYLASQGSLTYDSAHGLLYAVNAGSDTVTVFGVHGDHLVRHQVIGSGGSFPVSVATRGNVVYVLNARDGGSVQGFLRVGGALVRVPSWHRALGLDASQTPEFTSTPGQVAFTPDGRQLVVTTKGNGSDIDVFALTPGGTPSATPVVNADPGAVPFAVSFDAGGHLAVAEAGTNSVATFTVGRGGKLTLISRAATGQAATCWIVRDGSLFYASNAGSASLSGYADFGSGALHALGNTAAGAGTVDAVASPDGRDLYVRGGAAGTVTEFAVHANGSLTELGSVTVPDAVGGEGIAVS